MKVDLLIDIFELIGLAMILTTDPLEPNLNRIYLAN